MIAATRAECPGRGSGDGSGRCTPNPAASFYDPEVILVERGKGGRCRHALLSPDLLAVLRA
jgi:hypothetical protein